MIEKDVVRAGEYLIVGDWHSCCIFH
jgi:hypothetical protein